MVSACRLPCCFPLAPSYGCYWGLLTPRRLSLSRPSRPCLFGLISKSARPLQGCEGPPNRGIETQTLKRGYRLDRAGKGKLGNRLYFRRRMTLRNVKFSYSKGGEGMVALECNKSWLWEQSLPINFGRMSHFFLFIPCQSLKTNFCWENGLPFSPRHLALISNPLSAHSRAFGFKLVSLWNQLLFPPFPLLFCFILLPSCFRVGLSFENLCCFAFAVEVTQVISVAFASRF